MHYRITDRIYRLIQFYFFTVLIVQKRGQRWQTAEPHASEDTQKMENHSVGSRFVFSILESVQHCSIFNSKPDLRIFFGGGGGGYWDILLYFILHYSPSSMSGVTCDIIPNYVMKSLPMVRVRKESRLLYPGVQCRICLSRFQLGQHVRTLPCKHKVTSQVQLIQGLLNTDN